MPLTAILPTSTLLRASRLRHHVACLALALLHLPAGAQVVSITPGRAVAGEVTISDDPDDVSFVTYSFEAEDDVIAMSIELEAAADLDLYFDTEYIDDYQDVLAASTSFGGNERLALDLASYPELIGDRYYVDVAYGRVDPPIDSRGEIIQRIPFTLKVVTHSQRVDAEIVAGRIATGEIDPEHDGPFRTFVIHVPNGTETLRVDLASDATDLDLRVRRGEPMRTTRDADMAALSWSGHETIVVGSGDGPIGSGRYYIDVFDQAWLDWSAEFRLVASFSDRPPEGLVDLPTLHTAEGLEGAVRATVEVLHADGGGTGVLLSETGFILTNYHVIAQAVEAGTWTTASPLIGLTIDPTHGSHVRLQARIVAHDKALDFALLKAETTLYGAVLPDGYRFPAIRLGDPEALGLGGALFVLGYPDAGSLGTRVSITATSGIVSGFERRGEAVVIKTDADIAAGNSGGPVLNDRYELIGIATEAISEEFGNSQIGYIWPLWLVPEDWWRIVEVDPGLSRN